MPTRWAVAPILLVLTVTSATAQPRAAQRPGAPEAPPAVQAPAPRPDAAAPTTQRYEVATAEEERASETSHVLRLDGREIKYTATAGTLPIRLDDGKVAARMFFVAYTKDGERRGRGRSRSSSTADRARRPSGCTWAPSRPVACEMADEGFQPAPPYSSSTTRHSLLDVSDLVFVDAISTGFSRVMPGVDNAPVPRPGGRYPRLRRVRRGIPADLQPLPVAEVPDRRKLRHDPVGGPFAGPAIAPRHRAERHRPGVGVADVPDAVAGAEQRRRLRGADSDVRGDGVVPQAAAGRPAAEADRAGRRRGEAFAFGEYMLALRRATRSATPSGRRRPTSSRATRASRLATSCRPTCGSIPGDSGRNCCATGASSSAGSTDDSRRWMPTRPASGRSSTRRTPRCRARTSQCSRTTSGTS